MKATNSSLLILFLWWWFIMRDEILICLQWFYLKAGDQINLRSPQQRMCSQISAITTFLVSQGLKPKAVVNTSSFSISPSQGTQSSPWCGAKD